MHSQEFGAEGFLLALRYMLAEYRFVLGPTQASEVPGLNRI